MEKEKSNEKEFELLSMAFDRVASLQRDDQRRLYRFAGAYLAGAIAIISLIYKEFEGLDNVPELFWSLASLITTLYLAFYCYVSAHLIDAAAYLQEIWKRLNDLNNGRKVPPWDGFKPEMKFRWWREILNYLMTLWRVIVFFLSIILAYYGCSSDPLEKVVFIVAFTFSILIGGGALLVSSLYAIKAKKLHQEEYDKIERDASK